MYNIRPFAIIGHGGREWYSTVVGAPANGQWGALLEYKSQARIAYTYSFLIIHYKSE